MDKIREKRLEHAQEKKERDRAEHLRKKRAVDTRRKQWVQDNLVKKNIQEERKRAQLRSVNKSEVAMCIKFLCT